jgi:hypothetical protein
MDVLQDDVSCANSNNKWLLKKYKNGASLQKCSCCKQLLKKKKKKKLEEEEEEEQGQEEEEEEEQEQEQEDAQQLQTKLGKRFIRPEFEGRLRFFFLHSCR